MVGKFLAIGILLSTVLASLVLFPSGDAEALKIKIKCEVEIECDGPDGAQGTADDSCTPDPTYGAHGAGLTADIVTTSQIPAAAPRYSNVSMPAATGMPDTWKLSTDKEIPNGARVTPDTGLTAQATFAILDGPCTTSVPIYVPMYDCTTHNFEGVNDGCPANGPAESGFHCNDSLDNDGDTLVNDGCPKIATNDDAPDDTVPNDGCPTVGAPETIVARWCLNDFDDDGDTVVNDGCPQVGGFAESGAECVDAESGADCNDDEDDDGDGDPIVEWDTAQGGNNLLYGHQGGLPAGCNKYPQHVNTIMEGLRPRARYFGFSAPFDNARPIQAEFLFFSTEELTAMGALPHTDMGDATGYINQIIVDNPLVPLPPGLIDEICTPLTTSTNLLGITGGEGELSQDVPPVPTTAGSFWVVPDDCGDGVDDDGDTRTDEMCGIVRARNPAANTGILGTGSHLVRSYAESYRDADQDGIPNNEDECPLQVDNGVDADNDHLDSVCDPNDAVANPNQDGDLYNNRQDNCPLIVNNDQADADRDSIGDACDPNPSVPNGPYLNEFTVGSLCIGAADADGDGWCDTTEVVLGSAASTTPEGGTEAGYARCTDAIDNDGDTFIDGVYAPVGCGGNGCDAGCETPESYIVDDTVRAAENPPDAAPQTCTNYDYYDTTVILPPPHLNGAGNPVDDDGDTVVNQLDPGCACPGNDADCDGVTDGADNCPNDYNPTQLNTDGDALGDACDSDDDQDAASDTTEWAAGTDPKNVCDPRNYDLNTSPASAGVINILDVLTFNNVIMNKPCNPPVNYAVCEPIYRSVDDP